MAIEIVGWSNHYENNRTRELKHMEWVPIPNKQDGDGYTELLDHPRGAAHFGAWCALLQVASRCDPRGTLLRDGGKAHDPASLQRMTRIPGAVWKEVLPRLVSIGWITGYEIPQGDAEKPHPVAKECPLNGREGKGIEGKGKTAVAVLETPFLHRIEEGFLKHNGGRFTDYGKERAAIHKLFDKARARDSEHTEDLLVSVCAQFWKLKQGNDKFWRSQPFLPSALNASSIWDRVIESMRRDEVPADVKAIIEGGA